MEWNALFDQRYICYLVARHNKAESIMSIIGGSKRKPRKFDYDPRFYDSSKEDDIKRRLRVRRKSNRRDPTSILYLIGLLIFTIYIYTSL